MAREGTEEELARADAFGRRLGVGCFTLVTGFFGGAIISVLIGNIVSFLAREPECEGVPMCDWYVWFWTGGALGALALTIFIQTRLARPKDAPPTNIDRG
jgi:MFS family permease